MESLKLSFEAIMPIFLLMLLGYTIKQTNLADKKSFDTMNRLVFRVFLPVLLFYNIYKTKTGEVFEPKLILFTLVGIVLTFVAGYFAVLGLTKDNSRRGVMLQGFFRANFAILGVPLVGYICGSEAGGITSLMVAIVVPAFNVLSVVSLECFRQDDTKVNPLQLVKGVVKNPLIIGCIFGLVFFVFKIKLPQVLEKSVKDVSSIATPLAIVVLGASFEFRALKGYVRDVATVVATRLVLVPLVVLSFAVLFGFRGEAMACLLVTFASPVAVSSFAMSQQMGGDENLAAQVIVFSSSICLVTLFLWIFALSHFGLF